ncbi:ABC transporter ATP-binding protein [Marinilactibacillus kalidii]|uniref:ABC transporter ATP-binding protein n=1 Tax=Marinilactibacillus kalidii TaxID=2820274 RepID=UPI001ABDAF4C|nr:ABC transporter ATP-binding protein [Marinilactibacillus kalidii]
MFTIIKLFWKDNTAVALLLLVTASCQTLASVLMANAFNALVDSNYDRFIQTTLQMLLVYLLFLVFTFFQINVMSRVKQRMLTAIRQSITERLEKVSYKVFHEKQVGTYASWLSNDMNTIEVSAFDECYTVLSGLIATTTSVIALFFFHWSIVLLSFLIGALTLWLPKLFEKQLAAASLATTKENEVFLSRSSDVLSGFDTLFSFNLLERLTSTVYDASLALADAKNHQAKMMSFVVILGAIGNIFGQLSVLALTGFLAFQSILTVGAIASTGNLASTIFNTVGNLSQRIAGIRATRPIFEKFEEILCLDQPEDEGFQLNSGFDLRNVSYAYGSKSLFDSLTYSFTLGGKYAIIGASGSGKSTLLHLLNGKLTDYSGSISFSGHELSELTGRQLRQHVLYIEQAPYLFEGTIRENITMGESFSDILLEEAIAQSALDELIPQLPNGLDTPVGEGGRSLSGGQRQRIALARGLIRGKSVILIDEGTSSLDEASALKIEQHLVNNPTLTVLMVTHHLREKIRDQLDGIVSLG